MNGRSARTTPNAAAPRSVRHSVAARWFTDRVLCGRRGCGSLAAVGDGDVLVHRYRGFDAFMGGAPPRHATQSHVPTRSCTTVKSHGGHVVKDLGDGVFAVFAAAHDGVAAAVDGQRALDARRPSRHGRPRPSTPKTPSDAKLSSTDRRPATSARPSIAAAASANRPSRPWPGGDLSARSALRRAYRCGLEALLEGVLDLARTRASSRAAATGFPLDTPSRDSSTMAPRRSSRHVRSVACTAPVFDSRCVSAMAWSSF